MGKHSMVVKREKLWGAVPLDLRIGLAADQAISATTRRRSARILGAAAGGLLGVAFMPAAAAFADDYTIDPTGTETVTGIYGTGLGSADTAPPAVAGTAEGFQEFNYSDTSTGATGSVLGDESTVTDGFGDTNEEVDVTSSSGTDAPPVGSVFDTYTLGDSGYANIYSAVPSADGDVITDTWVTPEGDSTVPLTFDAADVFIADAPGAPLGDGGVFVPILDANDIVISVNGIPPIDMVLQGHEHFGVDNAAGTSVGTFAGDESTTADVAGTYTEAVLVTKDLSGTAGTADGDVPPVGSVFNTINLDGWENYYSDLTSTTGGADTITDTLVSPTGEDITMPTTFDAAAAETPVSVDLPDGDDITPVGTEVFNGVNGLPPVDIGVQGGQEFDVLSSSGTTLATFDADETKTLDLFGDVTQTLLVTSGDEAMPTGSVIETVSLGSGFENIYTDMASTAAGGDMYTDTLVTPFGDVTIPVTYDLATGLASDIFNILP
jgi:hypothetical protein